MTTAHDSIRQNRARWAARAPKGGVRTALKPERKDAPEKAGEGSQGAGEGQDERADMEQSR